MTPLQNKLSPALLLSTIDWLIFISLLIITLISVFYGNFQKKKLFKNQNVSKVSFNLLDHILMGRRLTLPLFIATLVATWYGGIFGVTEIAFSKGIYNFITQGVFWYITYILFAIFLVKKIIPYQAYTLPHLIKKMFGPKSAYLAAIFNLFNILPITYLISLGLFIQIFLNLSLPLSMLIGLGFVLSYSLWGGFQSVIFSDVIQFFIMCLSVFFVLFFSISKYGGYSFLEANLPPHYFSFTSDQNIFEVITWALIALSTLVDPNFYQRCFASNNPQTAKKGIFISTLIWACFDICTTLGAMYAKALIPHADSKSAYFIYALQVLPEGHRGFFIAGILATVLSTLDSYLFLAGTTLSYDLSPAKNHHKPLNHTIGILLVAIISFGLANFFAGDIKTIWKTLGSYSTGCLFFPMMMGYFFEKKFKDETFVATCLLSAISITLWNLIPKSNILGQIDSIYIGLFSSTLGLCFFSLYFAKKPIK